MNFNTGKNLMQYLLRISIFAIFVVAVYGDNLQKDFQPIPEDLKSRYHFDLAQLFFANEAAVKAEASRYNGTLSSLAELNFECRKSTSRIATL
jgi:hypothetical protein